MLETLDLERSVAEAFHRYILALLQQRFGNVPAETVTALRKLRTEKKKLKDLHNLAGYCPSLAAFEAALLAGPGPHLGGQQSLLDEERGFLTSLAEESGETTWLVYADWLEDHDESGCAGFIRGLVALGGDGVAAEEVKQ